MSAKTLILIVLFCLGIGLFLITDRTVKSNVVTPVSDGTNNFYMENFTITSFDENGLLSRVISGQQMTRETESGISNIVKPEAILYEDAAPVWKVVSAEGTINGDQSELTLRNKVRARHQPDEDLEIQTNQLDINLSAKTAESAQKVKIVHPTGYQEGIGMTAELSTNEMRLKSQVKGHYVQPQ